MTSKINWDDPNSFELCSAIRDDKRKLCGAFTPADEDVQNLQCCPNFTPESEATANDPTVYCTFCWAIGDLSVCEARPKGSTKWRN